MALNSVDFHDYSSTLRKTGGFLQNYIGGVAKRRNKRYVFTELSICVPFWNLKSKNFEIHDYISSNLPPCSISLDLPPSKCCIDALYTTTRTRDVLTAGSDKVNHSNSLYTEKAPDLF
jgi:hypothetical protein